MDVINAVLGTIAVAASLVGAVILLVFFFCLEGPKVKDNCTKHATRQGANSSKSLEAVESPKWFNALCIQWVGSLLLGGGSHQSKEWSERVECLLQNIFNCNSRWAMPPLRIKSLALGTVQPSLLNDPKSIAVATPFIGEVTSVEGQRADGISFREISVPVTYIDEQFHMALGGVVPVALGLSSLAIPADAVTVKCLAEVKSIRFEGTFCCHFCGSFIDLFFAKEPALSLKVSTMIGQRDNALAGGEKMNEIILLALKRTLKKVCQPNALRIVVNPQPPHCQFSLVTH